MTSTFQIENDLAYLKPSRQPSRWRQRLARFLRGQRRSKSGRTAPISQAPPRLGPIGQNIKFDTENSLVGDFSSLRFNDGGSLGDFKLSFEAPESDFGGFSRRNISGGSEREKDSKKVNVKRQSRSAAGESTRIHGTPSVDLPKFELDTGKGFLDTWLLNAVSTGTENNENKKPTPVGKAKEVAKPKTRTPIASQFSTAAPPIASQFSTVPLSTRSPLSEQTTNSKVRDQDTDLEAKQTSLKINGLNGHPVTSADIPSSQTKRKAEDLNSSAPTKRGSTARNSVITSSAAAVSPRVEEKLDSFPRPPSSVRQSVDYSVGRKESVPSQRLSIHDSRDEVPSRSMSVHSKRLSIGSDLGHETSYRTPAASKRTSIGSAAQVPGAVPSLVDSDTVSTASSSTSHKKFEIKTVNLLQPVTRTAADKQAEAVSNKISRINSGTMNAPTSAPRQGGERRVVTEQIRSRSRQEVERSPSRRFSQPGIRSSYMEASRSASPAPASQNTTPDIGSYPEAAARQRRPSSRLSDRMSWLRELEDANAKQTGRDFVFRKMEGGVASKLAAFENKTSGLGSGAQTPSGTGLGLGLSRSNSITSRMSSSDLYGIENSRLSRRTTHENPGSISDVVDEGFKKKLEGMTGNMASKIQKQAEEQGGSNTRGPAAMAAARRKIPQDVLDFIALSGVDPEIAINEYLQQGTLGKTKDWDHDEVLKQINTFVGEDGQAGKAASAKKETLPTETEDTPKAESVKEVKTEVKDLPPNDEAQKLEEQKPVEAAPSVAASVPETAAPKVEEPKDVQVEQPKEEAIEQRKEVIPPTTVDKKDTEPLPEAASLQLTEAPKKSAEPLEKEEVKPFAQVEPTIKEKTATSQSATPVQASTASSKPTGTAFLVTETNDSEKPDFNAASLPGFSN